jgi:CelD/BcsL family acetyltransferase involved in cellulose biosynthesis
MSVQVPVVAGRRPVPVCRVAVVRDLAGLAPHADAWDRLALAAPQRLPMLAHAWVASYLEHRLSPRETWWCALAYAGGRLVGVLPVVVTPHRLLGRRRPRLRTPWDLHTLNGDLLLARGAEALALRALLATLDQETPRRLGLELRGVRAGSPTLAALARGAPGATVLRTVASYGSFLPVAGTVHDFRARLGTRMRNNLRRARKRLQREARVEARFLAGEAATAEAFARFTALEAASWKGRAGTAVARSPGLAAFYNTLARRLAARGWLELHFLEADGRPIAGQLAVRFGQALVIPKIAYDEDFTRYAPGNLLAEAAIERAFADGDIVEINHASDMPWQRHWRMERSRYYTLWLYPRRPLALLFGAAPTAAWLLARRALRPALTRLRAARRARPRQGEPAV